MLRALLGAVALSVEALQAPGLPFEPWVHESKGHPGQIAVAALSARHCSQAPATRRNRAARPATRCAACRKASDRRGRRSRTARAAIEREINSANDNPLIDPETGALYKAGNFYGGHIARLLDTWKIDFAAMANWGNALMAVLVDDRFNGGLPANLTPRARRQFAASKACSSASPA